ncbi:MAG: hypothetical protein KF782_12055 [Labilithrix sp.]|nr:hypothetical protein [Labilithrix sp.]
MNRLSLFGGPLVGASLLAGCATSNDGAAPASEDALTSAGRITLADSIGPLTLRGDSVYFITARAIWKAPADGGDATKIIEETDPIGKLLVDDTSVFWVATTSDGEVIKRADVAGGAPVTLATTDDLEAIAQDDASVFWMTTPSNAAHTIQSVPKAGGDATTLAAIPKTDGGVRLRDSLVVDGGRLFVLGSKDDGVVWSGLVLSMPASGGDLAAVLSEEIQCERPDVWASACTAPRGLRVHDDQLFYESHGTWLMRTSLDGTSPTKVLDLPRHAFHVHVLDGDDVLSSDGGADYTDIDGTNLRYKTGHLTRTAIATGVSKQLASFPAALSVPIAASATRVFYANVYDLDARQGLEPPTLSIRSLQK